MNLNTEIRRKIFHHLSLAYLLLYAVLPVPVTVGVLFCALLALSAIEFLRLRRPELNAWFLKRFGGLHRPTEILEPSGIFWTLAGCWLTMVVLAEKHIVIAALGMLVFGDAASALAGRRWGKHPWPARAPAPAASSGLRLTFWNQSANPASLEGTAAFAIASFLWVVLFLRLPVALLGALGAAWIESRQTRWNDNFWIPFGGGLLLSVLSLLLGGGAGNALRLWQKIGIALYVTAAAGLMAALNEMRFDSNHEN